MSNKSKSVEEIKEEKKSVQEWFPIKDIKEYIAYRRDNYILSYVKVTPINFDLLSKNEKKTILDNFHEVLNGLSLPYQIFCIGKPVNIDLYILAKQETMNETDNPIKKRLQANYIKETNYVVSTGSVLERQYFVIFSLPKDKKAEESLMILTKAFVSNVYSSFECSICNEKEIQDILFNFFQQSCAAFERHDFSVIPPQIFSEE